MLSNIGSIKTRLNIAALVSYFLTDNIMLFLGDLPLIRTELIIDNFKRGRKYSKYNCVLLAVLAVVLVFETCSQHVSSSYFDVLFKHGIKACQLRIRLEH